MVDLTSEDFDELVARALDTLPAELAALMSNVAVFVEDQKPGSPRLLGLYEGVPDCPWSLLLGPPTDRSPSSVNRSSGNALPESMWWSRCGSPWCTKSVVTRNTRESTS